jgi:phasin family protein
VRRSIQREPAFYRWWQSQLKERNMAEIPSQLNDLSKESVETALAFARIATQNAERLVRLQLDAARTFVEENAAQAKSLAGVTDARELALVRAKAAEVAMQKAVDYSRQVYDMSIQTQGEMAKLMERRVSQFNDSMLAAMEQTFRAAPGSDAALAAFRSALAASTGAVSNMTRMAQQAGSMAADTAFKAAKQATAGKPAGRKK